MKDLAVFLRDSGGWALARQPLVAYLYELIPKVGGSLHVPIFPFCKIRLVDEMDNTVTVLAEGDAIPPLVVPEEDTLVP